MYLFPPFTATACEMSWKTDEACAASKPTYVFLVQGSIGVQGTYEAIGGLFDFVKAEREAARAKAEQAEKDLKQEQAKVSFCRSVKGNR